MDLKRPVVAPLYAEVRAHCSHINVYCKEGTFVVVSSTTHDSFLPSLHTLRVRVIKYEIHEFKAQFHSLLPVCYKNKTALKT